jgi:hypothetical protein
MPVPTVRVFHPLMRQTVTIAPWESYDDWGEPTYGTAQTYRCAVVGEMKMVRSATGQEAPSRQTIYLMSNAAIRPEDQITLSTGDVGSTESYAINPRILSVGRFPFLRGQYHSVVYLA